MGKGNENLVIRPRGTSEDLLTCRKISRHGTSGFTSNMKEGVLWTFIALKYLSPWPGSNLQPLGPVASTLTSKPPRQLSYTNSHAKKLYCRTHMYSDVLKMEHKPGQKLSVA
jgi:hypothetical protein